MTLRARYASQDEIPEALRSFFAQGTDGSWTLGLADAEDVYAAGLKANRNQALTEAKQLREKLAALEGMDPEEYKSLKAASEAAESERLTKAGEFDKLKAQLLDAHKSELSKRDERIKSDETQIAKLLRDSALDAAISEHKGRAALLRPALRDLIRVARDEKSGEYRVEVVDERGTVRIGDGQGTPMSIAGLVAEVKGKAEYSGAFDGSGASGGGAAGSAGAPPPSPSGAKRSAMTTDQKVAFVSEHGRDAFEQLPQ